ncbi:MULTISPECIES: YrbL family protein [Brenneria]|nr:MULTISPECIES: YrbL family protein [Brenneria]
MIYLDVSLLISKGQHRACYRHPLMLDKCIKVHLNGEYNRETIREIKYYKKIADKTFSVPIIAQYHGVVKTNLGSGYVFDLIKDYNGEVSGTLSSYLSEKTLCEKHKAGILQAYNRMKALAEQHAIVTMTLKPYNILYQLRSQIEGNLIIIDNLGCANLFPLAYYFSFFARQKLSRRFDDFENMLMREYGITFSFSIIMNTQGN